MEQKTALTQLLEWCNEFDDMNIKPTHTNMKEKIWQLLSVEKQQIIDAYTEGHENALRICPILTDGLEYYELTHTTKK